MKNLNHYLIAVCLITISSTISSKAQSHNVNSMIRALAGAAIQSGQQTVTKRCVTMTSNTKPKGFSNKRPVSSQPPKTTMKKGREKAETPPVASYQPQPRHHQPSPDHHHYTSSTPTSVSPNQISYHVDSSAQLTTNQIQFQKNSTEITGYSYQYLYDLANALKSPALRYHRFVIEGHASAEGSYSANQWLSQRRANAIFDFLVTQGIAPSRLLAVGHGEHQANYPASAPEYLRASDRRVMLFKLAE